MSTKEDLAPLPPARPRLLQPSAGSDAGPSNRPTPDSPGGTNPDDPITPRGGFRKITPGEQAMAMKYYKNSVKYEKLKIYRKVFTPITDANTAVTDGYNMYFPGVHFSEDFSLQDVGDRSWFIHEMGHTWQEENKVTAGNLQMGFVGGIMGGGYWIPGVDLYGYKYKTLKNEEDGKTEYPHLGWYGFEQQCAIIEDYYCVINGAGGLKGRRNYPAATYDDPNQGLLRYFLEDPTYLKNQKSRTITF